VAIGTDQSFAGELARAVVRYGVTGTVVFREVHIWAFAIGELARDPLTWILALLRFRLCRLYESRRPA
jgi:hypothetical protein